MIDVISDVVYDTNQSKPIAAYANEFNLNHPFYCQEILYQTKEGNYFLLCQGGKSTGYSQSVGGRLTIGYSFFPCTVKMIVEWSFHRGLADGKGFMFF